MKLNIVKDGKIKTMEINQWKVNDSDEGPSKKMRKLNGWKETDAESNQISLNHSLVEKDFIQDFSKSFKLKKTLETRNMKLMNDPFQVAVINEFLSNDSSIPELISEMEQLEWKRNEMDLYEFYQSTDLANVTSPHLSSFYNFINGDVKNWMEQLTGMKFKRASISCSMYNCGDFLLSHDDLLSDRLIAFVFYLSPWENMKKWKESFGGALELFQCDGDGQNPKFPPIKKVVPSNNQLVFFKVEQKSHHQVGEVITKDFPRLTINGWFHGFEDNVDYDADAVKIKKPNVPIFKSPSNANTDCEKIINSSYLKNSIKKEIQKQIEDNSEAGLGEFLTNDFLSNVENELRSSKLKWTLKGPANQQNYEVLNIQSLPNGSSLKSLVELMSSKIFFKLLFEYTELDLHGKNAKNPTLTIEFQRWKGGYYTLINDPSTYDYDSLDLILYIGKNESIGSITYLTPEGRQEEESIMSDDDDSVLLTIYPQNNFLNLVYRSSGTAKFTKYCYKSCVMESEFNYILYCSYKE